MTDVSVWEYGTTVDMMAAPDDRNLDGMHRPMLRGELELVSCGPVSRVTVTRRAQTLDGWMPLAWRIVAMGLDEAATYELCTAAEAELRGRIVRQRDRRRRKR